MCLSVMLIYVYVFMIFPFVPVLNSVSLLQESSFFY